MRNARTHRSCKAKRQHQDWGFRVFVPPIFRGKRGPSGGVKGGPKRSKTPKKWFWLSRNWGSDLTPWGTTPDPLGRGGKKVCIFKKNHPPDREWGAQNRGFSRVFWYNSWLFHWRPDYSGTIVQSRTAISGWVLNGFLIRNLLKIIKNRWFSFKIRVSSLIFQNLEVFPYFRVKSWPEIPDLWFFVIFPRGPPMKSWKTGKVATGAAQIPQNFRKFWEKGVIFKKIRGFHRFYKKKG